MDKILYIIFTHNRPKALGVCLESIFNRNETRPDRCLIIDDGSDAGLKKELMDLSLRAKFDYFSINPNVFYGRAFEMGLKLCEAINPKYVFFIESDYEFRQNGLDQVLDVLENTEYGRKALAVSLTDHPDYENLDKINNVFPRLAEENGLIETRDFTRMYKPFDYNGKYGRIKVEFVSNTCGCVVFSWQKMAFFKEEYLDKYNYWFDKSVDKGKEKRCLNDGCLSIGAALMWQEYYKDIGFSPLVDGTVTENCGAILNIKPSVGQHYCSGGINGKLSGFEELSTFVGSPSWGLTIEEYESGKRSPVCCAHQ